jgi:hypothetical protein
LGHSVSSGPAAKAFDRVATNAPDASKEFGKSVAQDRAKTDWAKTAKAPEPTPRRDWGFGAESPRQSPEREAEKSHEKSRGWGFGDNSTPEKSPGKERGRGSHE